MTRDPYQRDVPFGISASTVSDDAAPARSGRSRVAADVERLIALRRRGVISEPELRALIQTLLPEPSRETA